MAEVVGFRAFGNKWGSLEALAVVRRVCRAKVASAKQKPRAVWQDRDLSDQEPSPGATLPPEAPKCYSVLQSRQPLALLLRGDGWKKKLPVDADRS